MTKTTVTQKAANVNYTADQEKQIRNVLEPIFQTNDYDSQAAAIQELSERFDKKPASVRQKAVRMGIYIPKSEAPSNKRKGVTKADMVDKIAEFTETDAETMDSLSKSARPALQRILDTFERLTQTATD